MPFHQTYIIYKSEEDCVQAESEQGLVISEEKNLMFTFMDAISPDLHNKQVWRGLCPCWKWTGPGDIWRVNGVVSKQGSEQTHHSEQGLVISEEKNLMFTFMDAISPDLQNIQFWRGLCPARKWTEPGDIWRKEPNVHFHKCHFTRPTQYTSLKGIVSSQEVNRAW